MLHYILQFKIHFCCSFDSFSRNSEGGRPSSVERRDTRDGRDMGGRDMGRDMGGREMGGREMGGREMGGREMGGRDMGGREMGGRDMGRGGSDRFSQGRGRGRGQWGGAPRTRDPDSRYDVFCLFLLLGQMFVLGILSLPLASIRPVHVSKSCPGQYSETLHANYKW